MKSFDLALEDCLERIASGESVESCLQRYPQDAAGLRPLLQTALELRGAANVRPPETFKSRSRAQLMDFVRAHPHTSKPLPVSGLKTRSAARPSWRLKPAAQWIGALAVVAFGFFTTGTVLAQSALPGQTLYPWKRTSETVWQAVSPNPVATNLDLAQRRVQEAVAVSGPNRTVALQGYEQVITQLANQTQSDTSAQKAVVTTLSDQRQDLAKSGIKLPKLDQYLSDPEKFSSENSPTVTPEPTSIHKKHPKRSTTPGSDEDTPTPTPTPTQTPTPTPTLTPTPTDTGTPVNSSPSPQIIPATPTPPAPPQFASPTFLPATGIPVLPTSGMPVP